MKNSNKWVLAALLVLLASLAAYNMGLRAEYRRGTYKDPLRDTTALAFQDFSEVDVQAATAMNVKIVAGPYGVHVGNDAAQYVRISQQGPRLVVALAFPGRAEYLGRGTVVAIACPQLKRLTTSAVYLEQGQLFTAKEDGGGYAVQMQGFGQDSLVLRQDYASRIELTGNRLGYLRAEAGLSPGSRSVLRIAPDNRIGAATLGLRHRSELVLESAIPRLRYQFADSAKATFVGAALGQLRH